MDKKFKFGTTHHQFYLSDNSIDNSELEDLWTKEAYRVRTASRNTFIGILTGSYGPINGELIIHEKESNQVNFKVWDHIVETGIDLRSGKLEILDCPSMNVIQQVKLEPNKYTVRICCRGLKEAMADEEAGADFYRIEIWPGAKVGVDVIKAF